MSNPGQPTIRRGDSGEAVKRAQRALNRTAAVALAVDGAFGVETENAVKDFQEGNGLSVDGVVGKKTWDALPGGGAMPVLRQGSSGAVVTRLQTVLTDFADGTWVITPGAIDGAFGRKTQDSVMAFQKWAGAPVDGVVGQRTWDTLMGAAGARLENVVGLEFVVD